MTLKTIPIGAAVTQHFADIGHDMDEHNVVFENGQARERTQVLTDVANQTGAWWWARATCPELALGWATYNGDHMSMYRGQRLHAQDPGAPRGQYLAETAAPVRRYCWISWIRRSARAVARR